MGFSFVCANKVRAGVAVALLLGMESIWGTEAVGSAMGHADLVKQATQQSAAAHRIQALPDGRARVPSPMQAIEAEVSPIGVTVHSTAKKEPGEFTVRAATLGRTSGVSKAISRGAVNVESAKVRLIHTNLIEEFTTTADGVRQDFVVPMPPAGRGELELVVALDGAKMATRGDKIALILPSGRELLYHQLKVSDSRGKSLPARFMLTSADKLSILVDDRAARYPIRIDPTFTDADWVTIAEPATNEQVNALAWDGTSLYAGGNFTRAGAASANYIAKWDGSHWSALGTGMNANVSALLWDGTSLYAGGSFTSAGDASANYIAKWDGASWSALGNGMNGEVKALARDGTNLYAGGSFTTADGLAAVHVAKWDGSAWSALGAGVYIENATPDPSSVSAMVWHDGSLYAGGSFTHAGTLAANYIARWDGASWSALDAANQLNTNSSVLALASDGSNLYVGGSFTSAGSVTGLNYIAIWNGAWSALGSGLNGSVNALSWDGTNLFAGGAFTTAGGASANHVAKWNGSAWSTLGSGISNNVYALATDASHLFAGGSFDSLNYVAKFTGTQWFACGPGINGDIKALAWDGSNLYAGGTFTSAGGVAANHVAKWDGSAWSALDVGLVGNVNALALDGSSHLYAGGYFARTGDGVTVLNSIAKWNGSAWAPLGVGTTVGVKLTTLVGTVNALAWDGAALYAGGNFSTAGGVTVSRIAKWDPAASTWAAVGSGVGSTVNALASDGSSLFAGGAFTTAGGAPANRIAKWDGSAWTALGAGLGGTVSALALDGSNNLYAGGLFANTGDGGTVLNNIAKWDGSTWSALGSGVNNTISALVHDGTTLYAGGLFTTTWDNAVTLNGIAQWDGNGWSALGSGAGGVSTPTVYALALDDYNRVFAGGSFTTMAGKQARIAYANPPLIIEWVTAPADGKYSQGSSLDFHVDFALPVTVTGTPRISIDIGGQTRYADYLSGSGTDILIFRYIVQSTDNDADGITLISPLDLYDGTIHDRDGRNAELTFTAPSTAGILVSTKKGGGGGGAFGFWFLLMLSVHGYRRVRGSALA